MCVVGFVGLLSDAKMVLKNDFHIIPDYREETTLLNSERRDLCAEV